MPDPTLTSRAIAYARGEALRHALRVALTLGSLVATAGAQVTSSTSTTTLSTTTLQAPVLITPAMIAAFRGGLKVTALVTNDVLKSLALSWVTYAPSGFIYRVLRGAGPSGPWVAVGDFGGTTATVTGLPPAKTVYTRIVAVRNQNGVLTPTDTTYAFSAVTQSAVYAANFPVTCRIVSLSVVSLAWPRRGAASFLESLTQINGPYYAAPPPATLSDTTFLQAAPSTAGSYHYTIFAHYVVRDWPGPGQTLALTQSTAGGVGVSVPSGGLPVCQ